MLKCQMVLLERCLSNGIFYLVTLFVRLNVGCYSCNGKVLFSFMGLK